MRIDTEYMEVVIDEATKNSGNADGRSVESGESETELLRRLSCWKRRQATVNLDGPYIRDRALLARQHDSSVDDDKNEVDNVASYNTTNQRVVLLRWQNLRGSLLHGHVPWRYTLSSSATKSADVATSENGKRHSFSGQTNRKAVATTSSGNINIVSSNITDRRRSHCMLPNMPV